METHLIRLRRNRIKPIGKWLLGIGIAFMAVSCIRDTILNESFDVPQPSWNYSDPICFDVWIVDTVARYDLTFSLKHTQDYEWQNAFFLIKTIFPDMHTHIDTLECILSSPEGKWIGSRTGKYRRIGFLYKQGIAFPQKGEYRFEIRHAMRQDELKEITSVGMKVCRSY